MKETREAHGVELREGEGLVRTTIVGGQPRKRPSLRMSVKVGLERVLYLAATDRDFRTALLANRAVALRAAGLALSEGEAAVLDAVGPDSLAAMIDAVQPRSRPQRPFLKSVAATFLTLATGTASVGCPNMVSGGIEPDRDVRQDPGAEVDIAPDDDPTRGIETDVPPPVDVGIDPDIPDESPFIDAVEDAGSMDADVGEIYPDGGTQPDVQEFDAPPGDVMMDADAPVVGGILPDDPGAGMPDVASDSGADPAALPRPADRGGRA